MTYLPIVQRELRVAARRKSTHYARGAAALLAIVICFFWLVILTFGGSGSGTTGARMFMILSWYALFTTLLAGIFLASDSLSEERREGTLGLLFLTDLKGYDVVLGKFMAVSLNAFYGLLAVFPVLALCLLAGGVTGGEFWRTCLALVNLLFFSVTAGMLISSCCKSTYRAMTGTIGLLVIWLAVTRIIAHTSFYYASEVSPFEPFLMASDSDYFRLAKLYWESLAVSHLSGWVFLGLAGWRMRSFVDQGRTQGANIWQRVFTRDLFGGSSKRRARLLDTNPVLWLLDDSRRLRWVIWLLALAGAGVLLFLASKGPMALVFGSYATWPFYLLLKVFFAIQACRFFGESRRTGALELLCCTPLTMRAVIMGQWIMLRRVFMWPIIVLLGTHLTALIYTTVTQGSNSFPGVGPGAFPMFLYFFQFKVIPNNVADFFALGWFGMWLALTMQRPNMAAGLTILSVVILPMVAVCVPTLATDAIFIVVGWVKLSEDFRLIQAQWVKANAIPT